MQAKRNYKSDYDVDVEVDEEAVVMEREDCDIDFNHVNLASLEKHSKEKQVHIKKIKDSTFPRMRYFLESGFNLLIYGIGSKRNIMNEFAHNIYNSGEPVLVVNGYHSATNIRTIINSISKFIKEHIDKGTVGSLSSKKTASIHD
jgi:hypothetical protein